MSRIRRTSLIAVGCVAVLAGLGLSRKVGYDLVFWLLVFTVAAFVFKRRRFRRPLLIAIVCLALGLWRGNVYMQHLHHLQVLSGHQTTIQAEVLSDAIYTQNSQLEFTAGNVKVLEPEAQNLKGQFKISGFGENMVYRGDKLEATGKIYPSRGSNQARMSYAQITRIGADNSLIHSFTRKFSAGMQNALPEPQASFGLGLLIGQRTTLPQDLVSALTLVGLVHIVAVSGYNVTILARAAAKLKLPSKYQQLWLSLALIGAFILMTGFSASIVRAAIVSLLSLWAWYYGRKIRPIVLILFTAALTGLANPFYVWSDLGWYLSFLAFFGILIIAPILISRIFTHQPNILAVIVIETLCAEVMALPVIMMIFGQVSLLALLANVLVVPLVPYAMLLCTFAAMAGMWLAPVAGWIAWPAKILLTYMLDIVHMLASIPSVAVQATISPLMMIGCYVIVLLIVLAARHHLKNKKLLIQAVDLGKVSLN
jgi:competence protein ComEC